LRVLEKAKLKFSKDLSAILLNLFVFFGESKNAPD
jgi:hypothetical protein